MNDHGQATDRTDERSCRECICGAPIQNDDAQAVFGYDPMEPLSGPCWFHGDCAEAGEIEPFQTEADTPPEVQRMIDDAVEEGDRINAEIEADRVAGLPVGPIKLDTPPPCEVCGQPSTRWHNVRGCQRGWCRAHSHLEAVGA